MNTIGKKLAELRIQKGFSQPEVAKRLTEKGMETNSQKISKWETDYSIPNVYQFLLLCELYNIRDVLEIFGISKNPLSYVNHEGRKKVDEYIELLTLSGKYDIKQSNIISIKREIKLFDLPVSAGMGEFLDSDRYQLIEVDDQVPENVDFGLRIAGNSMEPEYHNGQIIFVHKQDVLSDGEIGIFGYENNAYCKKLSLTTAGTKLISLNKTYAPIEIPRGAELHVFGKVVGKDM